MTIEEFLNKDPSEFKQGLKLDGSDFDDSSYSFYIKPVYEFMLGKWGKSKYDDIPPKKRPEFNQEVVKLVQQEIRESEFSFPENSMEECSKELEQKYLTDSHRRNNMGKLRKLVSQDEIQDVNEFVDENENLEGETTSFQQEDSELKVEELLDAITAIDKLAEVVLESEGIESEEITPEETEYVLDEIQHLAASMEVPDDELNTPDDDEDLDQKLNKIIKVISVRTNSKKKGKIHASLEEFGDSPSLVLVIPGEELETVIDTLTETPEESVIEGDDFVGLEEEVLVLLDDTEDLDDASIQEGYLNVSSYMKNLNSSWKDTSSDHLTSWNLAVQKLTAQLGHEPESAVEIAAVQTIAKKHYDKYFSASADTMSQLKKVGAAKINRVISFMKRKNQGGSTRLNSDRSLDVLRSKLNDEEEQILVSYGDFHWAAAWKKLEDETYQVACVSTEDDEVRTENFNTQAEVSNYLIDWFPREADYQVEVLEYGVDEPDLTTKLEDKLSEFTNSSRKVNSDTNEVEGLTGSDVEHEVVNTDGNSDELNQVTIEVTDDGTVEVENNSEDSFVEPEYNFESEEIEVIETPLQNTDSSCVLVLKKIHQNVRVLDKSYLRKNSTFNSGYYVGNKASEFLQNNASKLIPFKDVSGFNSKVINLRSSNTHLYFNESSIFGLIAIKGKFVPGIKNARYTIFSVKSGQLVDKFGNKLTGIRSSIVIASPASNRSVVKSHIKRDLISEVEKSYVVSLKKRLNFVENRLVASRSAYKKQIEVISGMKKTHKEELNTLRSMYQKKILSTTQDLEQFRSEVFKTERKRIFQNNEKQAQELSISSSKKAEKDIQHLTKSMSRF